MICNTDLVLLNKHLHRSGGLEKYTRQLATTFAKEGLKVSVLTTDDPVGDEPYKVIKLRGKSSLSFQTIKKFDHACISWLQNNQPKIIFGMDRNSHQTHYRAGGGVHKSYLNSREEGFFKKLSFKWNPLHRLILDLEKKTYESPNTKRIFVNSQMVKQEILSHYSTDPDKITVVHNGVEWEEWGDAFANSLSQRSWIFNKLRLDSSLHHFLFIGHGYKRKGLIPLLKALAEISSRKWHLSVVGKEKHIETYIDLSKKLGIDDRVTFFGPVSTIQDHLSSADTLVIPSYYDPFANVTVEALAMGLYVLSSSTNGGHEVLNTSNGATFDLANPNTLVKALKGAFKKPKTVDTAREIRTGIKHLDFKNQLSTIVQNTLQDAAQ